MMSVTIGFLLVFAVTYVVLVEALDCPHDWLDRPGSTTCYSFRFKQKKSWSDARLECQRYDGDLLKIETDEEKVWVLSKVHHIENVTFGNVEWWTGLNNREHGDIANWFWADGEALEPSVLQWSQGEPNNYLGQEHCAEIWQGIFNDTNCDQQLYYICERPKSAPLSCDGNNGWEHLRGNCYKSMPISMNYEDAKYSCTQHDASLVDIFNEDMQQLVTDLAKQYEKNSWLGLHVVNDMNGKKVLEWTNGSSPLKTWWSESETSNDTLSNTSSCVILNVTKNDLQNWEYAECSEGSSFICTKESGLCSDGWMQREGHCYFFLNQKKMTWKDSVAFCNLRGAMLIQMNSSDNMQFLSTELPKHFAPEVESMWLGISGKDGSWSWLSGDTFNITSPMWAENASQTDNDGLTKCSYILRDDRDLKWQISADCSIERGVICTAPSNVSVQPPPPVFPESKCLDNWLAGIHNCFRVNSELVTWFEARMKCQQDGGDLAVIANEQDQKLLSSQIQHEVWIGLNDREQEKKFVWLDQNDQVSLTYWRRGNPDNQIIGNMYSENCVAMGFSIGSQDHGKWIDYPCAFKLGFVCQRMAVRNIAVGKTAKQSSSLLMHMASFAVDNNISYNLTDGSMCSNTSRELNPWWEVDLGTQYNIGSVIIHHRMDNDICLHGKQDLRILLKNDTSETGIIVAQDQHCLPHAVITAELFQSISARYVRIDVPDKIGYLALCEVEVLEAIPGQQSQSTTSARELPPSNSTGCGGSWTRSLETDQCYRKGNNKLTWTDAREACRSWKATLVSVRSLQEELFLAEIAQNEENLWIGVSAIPADSSVWLTIDRKTVSFSNWMTYIGEPVSNDPDSNYSTGRNRHSEHYERKAYCALKSVPRRKWHAVNCQRRESYICLKQEESVPACTDGWIADCAIKTCYKFEKTLRNWHGAESACETWNSHLVHLKSETKYNFVLDAAQKLHVLGMADGIWIGLHDSQVEGNWTWSDGTPFLLKKWAPKQPDDWKGNEDCGGIESIKFLNDYSCTRNLTSVCERPAILIAACDHGWELDPNTGTCFKFGYENKTWMDARAACQKFGGDLANVNSPDEQLYIYNKIHGITNSQGCWIGVSDTTTENIWKGVDGSRLTYTDWGQDEPNNMHIEENCASICFGLSPNHGRWNDQNCTLMLPYVCEKSVFDLTTSSRTNTTNASTTSTSKTEEKMPEEEDYPDCNHLPSAFAWDSCFGEFCYQINDYLATWQDARIRCQRDGGDLLSITSKSEELYIDWCLRSMKVQAFWIGANDHGTEGGWKWSNGDPYFYFNWDSVEPNNTESEEGCGAIMTDISYKWHDLPCSNHHGYICKKKGMAWDLHCGSMSEAYVFEEFCYQFNNLETTWENARKRCQRDEGDLLSITSKTEELYIDGHLKYKTLQDFWIGANDLGIEGVWTWSNGDPYFYSNWDTGEPNNTESEGGCGAIMTDISYKWHDLPCSNHHGYICKKKGMAWDLRCGSMSNAYLFEEFCYQFNDLETTWENARNRCQRDEGDLLSITSKIEELYIDGHLRYETLQDFWIGANDLGIEGNWIWSNGDPYFYSNWNTGEPNNRNEEDCAEITANHGYKWNDLPCNSIKGYICKKKASLIMSTPIPTTKPSNKSETGSLGCYQNWLEYDSSCYLFVQERIIWDTALQSCRMKGGDLVSVTNQEQQNFIFSQMSGAPFHGFWIGMSMNNKQTSKLFKWSDNSKVTFTTWSKNEPDNYRKEKRVCVTLGQQTGLWTDESCSKHMSGYICRMERISQNFTSLSPVVSGCYDNSMRYGLNCYQFVSNGTSWNNAQETCVNKSGNLAIITDRRTQAFLSSQMVFQYTNYWIGLRKTNDTRMYQWVNGGEVTYTSWYKDVTGNEDTSCVSIRALTSYGLWETDNCSKSLPYICQIPLLESTQSSILNTSVTTAGAPCPSSWTQHDMFCYKISISEVTWFQARASCLRQGADLTSIMNDAENMFIENLFGLSRHEEIWVGLNCLDEEKGYKWSDGSALIFTKWGLYQPYIINCNQKCVEMTQSTQSGVRWNGNNCYKAIGYICKKSRDYLPNSCGTDLPWKYYKDYCYYTSFDSVKTWHSAQTFCVDKGAALASIHSEMENNVIFSMVSRLDSQAWIGLKGNDSSRNNYVWWDKTAFDFINWGLLEPMDVCVTMSSDKGTWYGEPCDEELPFVCKRRFNRVTPLEVGGCPPDFFIVGSKCVLIRSTARYDFGTARNSCIHYGTGFNLASINSHLEQMFLVLRMREAGSSSVFIGLKDMFEDGQYDWLDNSPVTYQNFRAGQPSSHAMEHCVEMFSDGTWNNLNCASLRGFICQGPRDSNLSEPTPTIPTSHCPVGYTVYPITKQCYRILNSSQSWNESLTLCQADGATLATISDLYDMYFLEILSSTEVNSESPLWIGLADFKGTGVFQWVSGATVTYTKWGDEVLGLKENTCVTIHKGFWKQVSCNSSHPAICQAVREVLEMGLGTGQIVGIITGSVGALVILGVFIYVCVHSRCRHFLVCHKEIYVQATAPGNNNHVYEFIEMDHVYESIDN